MNKLVATLGIITILLGSVCGVLFNQISDLENQNNVLEEQADEYQNQIGQLENHTNELEIYYLNMTEQLEMQIAVIENQTSDYYLNQMGQLENQVNDLKKRLAEELRFRIQVNITALKVYGWDGVSTRVKSYCNVTVQNFGTNDVDDLMIRISGVTLFGDWRYKGEQAVGLVKAGETKLVHIESAQEMMTMSNITAKLMLDDIIIDERYDLVFPL